DVLEQAARLVYRLHYRVAIHAGFSAELVRYHEDALRVMHGRYCFNFTLREVVHSMTRCPRRGGTRLGLAEVDQQQFPGRERALPAAFLPCIDCGRADVHDLSEGFGAQVGSAAQALDLLGGGWLDIHGAVTWH